MDKLMDGKIGDKQPAIYDNLNLHTFAALLTYVVFSRGEGSKCTTG